MGLTKLHINSMPLFRIFVFWVIVNYFLVVLEVESRPSNMLALNRFFFSFLSSGYPGTHYVDQTGLDLKRSACLSFPSAGIKGGFLC